MLFRTLAMSALLAAHGILLADMSLPIVPMPENSTSAHAANRDITAHQLSNIRPQNESNQQHSLTTQKVSQIRKILQAKLSAEKLPSLAVSMVIDGSLAWSEAFGLADLENDVTAHKDTVYRSASLVKPITATAIMQLVEYGLLDLDAPIQEYCKEFPVKKHTITTRYLLSHTAGIRSYPKPKEAYLQEIYNTTNYKKVTDTLKIFAHDPLLFQPGTAYQYTSYGYNLLACVIEGISGTSWQNYFHGKIFNNAGMSYTREDDPEAIIPHRAAYYARDYKGNIRHARYADLSSRSPGAGLVTTAPDMMRFVAALFNNHLLEPLSFQQMIEPTFLSNGDVIEYGFGWGLEINEDFHGLKEVSHGGMVPGVSSMLYLLPEEQFGVIIITNLSGVEGRMELVRKIAEIALDLPNRSIAKNQIHPSDG